VFGAGSAQLPGQLADAGQVVVVVLGHEQE
jgi:hypothetical protein